ncbi:MAG: hypothetical protein ACREBB_02990 [Nitrosotalea sp.]
MKQKYSPYVIMAPVNERKMCTMLLQKVLKTNNASTGTIRNSDCCLADGFA